MFAFENAHRPGDIGCDVDVLIVLEQTSQPVAGVLFVVDNEDCWLHYGTLDSHSTPRCLNGEVWYKSTMSKWPVPLLVVVFAIRSFGGAPEESLKSIDPNDGWKPASQSHDLAIYFRVRSGSPIKEFKAVGDIDAPSQSVRAVIDDFENYPSFMPYTVECRLIKRDGDS